MWALSVDYSKITDFELAIILAERDIAAFKIERYDEIINAIGQAKGLLDAEKAKTTRREQAVLEENFSQLSFEAQKGQKLGDYEIADKNRNDPTKWLAAYDILKKTDATIMNRYKGQGYTYGYWVYSNFERIYRQKRKGR